MPVAFPSNVACAIVLAGAQVMAGGVKVVAVVFFIFTHVDRVLTELAIISLTLTCAVVNDLKAVTSPLTDRFMTRGVVHARVADALIDVDITVATQRRIIRMVVAFHDGALILVLEHKRYSVGINTLCAVLASGPPCR